MASISSDIPEQKSTNSPSEDETQLIGSLLEDETQLPPYQSELGDAEQTAKKRSSVTKSILEYILRRQRSRIIFIFGLLRSGKSSLFEALVGKRGYAGDGIHSVTEEYQLGCAKIDGQFYIFVDTPGFDDARTTGKEVFRNIVSCIELIRGHAIFTGILYVHKLDSVLSAGQDVFISWLEAFCGTLYMNYVTFVTTKWDEINPTHLDKKLAMLDEWKEKWSDFLKSGAQIYHHGRKYTESGDLLDIDTILDESKDEHERKNQARMMITRCYKGKPSLHPWLVVELSRGTKIENTKAGKVLDLHPSGSGGPRPPVSGPNWFRMLMSLYSTKLILRAVTQLIKSFPKPNFRSRSNKKRFELIWSWDIGLQIAVGWGPKGLYFASPPDDSDDETKEDAPADEWHGDINVLLSTFSDVPGERELKEAFQQALQEGA